MATPHACSLGERELPVPVGKGSGERERRLRVTPEGLDANDPDECPPPHCGQTEAGMLSPTRTRSSPEAHPTFNAGPHDRPLRHPAPLLASDDSRSRRSRSLHEQCSGISHCSVSWRCKSHHLENREADQSHCLLWGPHTTPHGPTNVGTYPQCRSGSRHAPILPFGLSATDLARDDF